MANVLSDEKRQQVEALGRLGWSLRRIEREADVRRETASAYLKAAGIKVRGRGGSAPKPATSAEVITDSGTSKPATSGEVITDSNASKPATSAPVISGSVSTESLCEPFREQITRWLRDGRTAMSVWQELVERHGFAARYATVQRFVRRLAGTGTPEARVVITTVPGEESQVDYGEGPMVRYRATGKYRRTRLFLLTLAHSRKSVRLLTWKSSTRIWAELHEKAFRRLGGVTATVVLDNLREGVLTPDIHDPLLNPLYRDVLAHYGALALPCRVRDPDRKGKVESGIAHTQKALRGQRFETLEDAQKWLDRWDERWADTRIHGTTKRQVAAMFSDERPHLKPLPVEPFRYYAFGERVVHLDGFVEVASAYYAPPPGWIGRSVRVQWGRAARAPARSQVRRAAARAPVQDRGRHSMRAEDQPSRTPPQVAILLARAHGVGPATGAVADAIYAESHLTSVRHVLGLCALAKKYGAVNVEAAAKVALDAGALTYRFVRAYLERHQTAPVPLRQIDPLFRELTHYRDLVRRMTEGDQS